MLRRRSACMKRRATMSSLATLAPCARRRVARASRTDQRKANNSADSSEPAATHRATHGLAGLLRQHGMRRHEACARAARTSARRASTPRCFVALQLARASGHARANSPPTASAPAPGAAERSPRAAAAARARCASRSAAFARSVSSMLRSLNSTGSCTSTMPVSQRSAPSSSPSAPGGAVAARKSSGVSYKDAAVSAPGAAAGSSPAGGPPAAPRRFASSSSMYFSLQRGNSRVSARASDQR